MTYLVWFFSSRVFPTVLAFRGPMQVIQGWETVTTSTLDLMLWKMYQKYMLNTYPDCKRLREFIYVCRKISSHCQPQSTNIGDKQEYRVNILVQLGQGQNNYMFLHMAICQSPWWASALVSIFMKVNSALIIHQGKWWRGGGHTPYLRMHEQVTAHHHHQHQLSQPLHPGGGRGWGWLICSGRNGMPFLR